MNLYIQTSILYQGGILHTSFYPFPVLIIIIFGNSLRSKAMLCQLKSVNGIELLFLQIEQETLIIASTKQTLGNGSQNKVTML